MNRQVEILAVRVKEAEGELSAAEQNLSKVAAVLDVAKKESPTKEALAELAAYGKQLGLQNGTCPLCGSTTHRNSTSTCRRFGMNSTASGAFLGARAEEHAKLKTRTESLRDQVEDLRTMHNNVEKQLDAWKLNIEVYKFKPKNSAWTLRLRFQRPYSSAASA